MIEKWKDDDLPWNFPIDTFHAFWYAYFWNNTGRKCSRNMPIIPLYEKEWLEEKRNYPVAKANALVREARYSLSTQQQKIVLYLISQIKPEDEDFKQYKFDMKDFARLCGIQCHGENYQNFKDSLKALHDNSFWLIEGNKHRLLTWLQDIEIDTYETTVSLRLDSRLKPYLLKLKDSFTIFNFGSTLMMRSKHSIRLLEIFASYRSLGMITFTIEELKETLECGEYTEYKDFRRYVIDKALEEINKYSEITVEYKPIKHGRSVYALLFTITEKSKSDILRQRLEREAMLNDGK